jgi:hypothetical protein
MGSPEATFLLFLPLRLRHSEVYCIHYDSGTPFSLCARHRIGAKSFRSDCLQRPDDPIASQETAQARGGQTFHSIS